MSITDSSAFARDNLVEVIPSKTERFAIETYQHINNSRLIIGLFVIIGLTAISITFNYILGKWTANDPESNLLLPKGYALLDVGLLFICLMLATGIQTPFLRWCARIWCGVLFLLSLWACAAFTMAVDTINLNKGTLFEIQQLEKNIAIAQRKVATWQEKLKNTSVYSSKFNKKLNEAEKQRDYYQSQLARLKQNSLPPALIIFNFLRRIIPGEADLNTLIFFVRLIWGAALIITPLLCMSIIASEIRCLLPTPEFRRANQDHSTAPLRSVGSKSSKGAAVHTQTQSSISELQYQKIKKGILSGEIRPSHAAIKKYCSSDLATEFQRRMATENVLIKTSRGYMLTKKNSIAA